MGCLKSREPPIGIGIKLLCRLAYSYISDFFAPARFIFAHHSDD